MKCTRTAFTLIELIIVVSVIAVLTGLVLPLVSSIQAAADRTRCQNNLSQVHMATMLYCTNNFQLMPYPSAYYVSTETPHRATFKDALADAFLDINASSGRAWDNANRAKSNTVAICPTVIRTYPRGKLFIDSGWGGARIGAKPADGPDILAVQYGHNSALYDVNADGTKGFAGARNLPLFWIKRPELWPLWGDSAVGAWGPGFSSYVSIPDMGPHYGPVAARGIGLHHRNMGNLVFADGHGGKIAQADIVVVSSRIKLFENN